MGCTTSKEPESIEPKPKARAPKSENIFEGFSEPCFSVDNLLTEAQKSFNDEKKDSSQIDFPRSAYFF